MDGKNLQSTSGTGPVVKVGYLNDQWLDHFVSCCLRCSCPTFIITWQMNWTQHSPPQWMFFLQLLKLDFIKKLLEETASRTCHQDKFSLPQEGHISHTKNTKVSNKVREKNQSHKNKVPRKKGSPEGQQNFRAAFKFGRRVHFVLRRKMVKPPIAVWLDLTDRPSGETVYIYEANVRWTSTRS